MKYLELIACRSHQQHFRPFGRVGALNGLILPISFVAMLVASCHPRIVGSYGHARWLTAAGVFVTVTMAVMGVWSIWKEIPLLFR